MKVRIMMLKCYEVYDKNLDYGQTIVWAETSNKAKLEGQKDDIFDWCEYIDLRTKRRPEWDKYADTKHIPIQELLDESWWFGCAICSKEGLDQSRIEDGEAFIYDEKAEYYKFVRGNLICADCKKKLDERIEKFGE